MGTGLHLRIFQRKFFCGPIGPGSVTHSGPTLPPVSPLTEGTEAEPLPATSDRLRRLGRGDDIMLLLLDSELDDRNRRGVGRPLPRSLRPTPRDGGPWGGARVE